MEIDNVPTGTIDNFEGKILKLAFLLLVRQESTEISQVR